MPVGVATLIAGPGESNTARTTTFRSPALGEPRTSHAIAPTKGDRKSGAITNVSMRARAGRSVRLVSQAMATPPNDDTTATSSAMTIVEESDRR